MLVVWWTNKKYFVLISVLQSAQWINSERIYPQTRVSSFSGLITWLELTSRKQLMSPECSKHYQYMRSLAYVDIKYMRFCLFKWNWGTDFIFHKTNFGKSKLVEGEWGNVRIMGTRDRGNVLWIWPCPFCNPRSWKWLLSFFWFFA